MNIHADLKRRGLFCLVAVWTATALASAQPLTRLDKDGNRSPLSMTVRLSNPAGVYAFRKVKTSCFQQQLSDVTSFSLQIRVTVPPKFPEFQQVFPLEEPVPENVQRFLKPTAHIQSNAPEIARAAEEIVAAAQPKTAAQMLRAVCDWTQKNVPYSTENPSEITDALAALKRGKAHAVGITHLAAALLRNRGIPVRIVRTYCVYTDGPKARLARHSLIEAYFPKDKTWVLVNPQVYAPVAPQHLYLYATRDWDQKKHDACKPFSVDPRTQVEVLRVE